MAQMLAKTRIACILDVLAPELSKNIRRASFVDLLAEDLLNS